MKHYVSLLGMFMIILALFFMACCGSGGENGSNGENGYSLLINQSELAPGAECSAGGVQIDTGLDTDSDGILDADEITNTEYVCNGEGGEDGEDGEDLTDYDPGTVEIFTADSVSFNMMYVPGDVTFPTGMDDDGEAKVYYPYWIGETEVTYELWDTVHTWAIANGYAFANAGTQGDGTGDTDQHPVTTVNWRDAMVWCNALTEWYNAWTGTNFTCVYTYEGAIVRNSQDSNATACDNVVENSSATGFRLLSSNEWELAARWRTDSTNTVSGYSNPWFTQGDSASGATADYNDAIATGLVAWYDSNSGLSTHEVKGKTANSLGLYDMSGNVDEWCFDLVGGSNRVMQGGGWGYPVGYMQVGFWIYSDPFAVHYTIGFRFARTQ